MTKLIVTGVDGFVGRHVAQCAADAGIDVFGISRTTADDVDLGDTLAGYASADLRTEWPRDAPRDAPVIHLAGLAAVGASFDHPQRYINDNSAMVTTMCEALLDSGATGTRIVGVSSGAVYAQNDARPARVETDAVEPSSPYVVSKLLVENQLTYYHRRGLSTVIARPFNHIGPGQGPGFLVPDLIEALRALTNDDALRVGDLSTRRDYTDVRDVARAYLTLAAAPELGWPVYNVASSRSLSGGYLLDVLCAAMGRKRPRLAVDPARTRATDPANIVGDAGRFATEFRWRPGIPIEQTIRDIVSTTRPSG